MSYFEPETWRPATRQEFPDYLAERRAPRRDDERSGDILVIRKTISPFDLYTYLKARFGEPNGLMTRLASDDSDNLFHWDYLLYAGDQLLTFTGATREVHVSVERRLDDAEWLAFIRRLRTDFGRVGQDKGRVAGELEKWSVFPNRFLAIANRCADLFHDLSEALPKLQRAFERDDARPGREDYARQAERQAALVAKITAAALELPILTPVLFECFLGLVVGLLVRPEVKADLGRFDAFSRGRLNDKILSLHDHCRGFARGLLPDNEALQRFWPVVARRNDLIHGNLDPVRDAVEIVYFDRKRPLHTSGGAGHRSYWDSLMVQYRPQRVIDDYLAMHHVIHEILEHMEPQVRATITAVMGDTQPGWDQRRRKIGLLFPGHVVGAVMPGLRYDSELRAPRGRSRTAAAKAVD
ncbi:hypothetical protein [Caulobacter sp. FWC26]|uniref:hypothetical protein n=1 Tax=Caulobacter sp. FWC26 TaxID=69665 RepID=UPI000C1611B7|nr:hypothetical protein [Caulobacter sp. FWC26]AZS19195.1 hypothetical protein CSW63_00220 [Caulobacter sp. FWC26]